MGHGTKYRTCISAGDLDGLPGLELNNLIQILLILGLCRGVLGFPDSLLFGPQLLTQLAKTNIWAAGVFALEQGQIITAMLLSVWSCMELCYAPHHRDCAVGAMAAKTDH